MIADVLQKINMPMYAESLICTQSRKTCTNLAKELNETHDTIYSSFRSPIESGETIKRELLSIAQNELSEGPKYLIFDDAQLSKPYAKEIEGLDVGFDGSTGRAELGLQIITAMITNGKIRLPIGLTPYFGKQIAKHVYKTKSALAIQITLTLYKLFNFDLVIADAHYSTKTFLSFLSKIRQAFLMKFTCSRIVTIGAQTGQLRKILRLKRNAHFKSANGLFDGISYYFYVVKVKNGVICYFISLHEIQKDDLIALYKIRWNIELYHRTAKQSLGWKDCQMRAIEKQELHSLYVMYSYAIAELVRTNCGFDSTESALRELQDVKKRRRLACESAFRRNFCYVA